MTIRRKDVAINLRFRPEMKKALELAAARECRSQTSMIEWLLLRYCEQNGINVAELMEPLSSNDQ